MVLDFYLDDLIKNALKEDINYIDTTADLVIPEEQRGQAYFVAKASGVLCGIDAAMRVFRLLDDSFECTVHFHDGDRLGFPAENRLTVRQTEALVERMLTEPPRAPAVRSLCRDHRLFVNAVTATVKALQRSNAAVTSRVVEHERDVEVIVTIPRAGAEILPIPQMPVAKTAETC